MDVGERAALVEVPVTLESAIGSRDRAVDSDHGRLGLRGDDDGLDSTGPAWRATLAGLHSATSAGAIA
jgi:hypothetical protein